MALPTLDMNPEELAPAASKQNENWTRTETSGAAQWQSYRCLWGMSSIKQLQIVLPVQILVPAGDPANGTAETGDLAVEV